MASAVEKLAASLEVLRALQAEGRAAIRSADLSRTDRERLLAAGFLSEVIKGWYAPAQPDQTIGESTAWYAAFWPFCAQYLESRFGSEWSLSPEQSLLLHAGNWSVPRQLLVRAPGGRNNATAFPHGTSIYEVRASLPGEGDGAFMEGLRLFGLEAALVQVSESFFQTWPTEARTALAVLPDASGLLARLLEGGHVRAAGRLAGALRGMGRGKLADEILAAMRAALHDVREVDPLDRSIAWAISGRSASPYVHRIRILWESMREDVVGRLPSPAKVNDAEAYLAAVEDRYVADAYHSLSIEGYQVTPELIERVRSGVWNPDANAEDHGRRDALAARGYWQAFQEVKASVGRILAGENPGHVADEDHGRWYRELFAPSVAVGLVKPAQLAGYRNGPVFIRRSMHVPMGAQAVRDAMPTFFELLAAESDPSVRIVLGHFVFVYIHPYFDGNGRMGRFLMNAMIAAAGHPWTVIRLEGRDAYMSALEAASVGGDIRPFADFIASAMSSEPALRGASRAKDA